MKILVVGGAGYIGGYLTDLLSKEGYDVTVLDSLVYESRYLKKVQFIRADITDYNTVLPILNNYDAVVWLAALVGDGACAVNPNLSQITNFETVKRVVDSYNGLIIFTSTCSVYGVNHDLIDENSPTKPLSVYAETKLGAERYIVNILPSDRYLVFRLGTLYGLGDEFSRIRLDLVANLLTYLASTGKTLTVNGGEQWRPLLHVKDVSHAILFGLKRNIRGLYNLSNKNYNIKDIAEEIRLAIPEVVINYVPMKTEDLRDYRVKNDKILATGWFPTLELKDGIKEIIDVFRESRIVNPEDPIYNNHVFLKQAYAIR